MFKEDALTSFNQFECNRTLDEMKMPERWSSVDFFPDIADARNWRFEQSKLFHFSGILRGIGIGHHQADVVPHQIDLLIAKALHKLMDIGGNRLLVVTCGRPRRVAKTAHVRCEDRVVRTELIEKRNPHVRRVAESVNQYERLFPGSGLQVVNLYIAQVRRV